MKDFSLYERLAQRKQNQQSENINQNRKTDHIIHMKAAGKNLSKEEEAIGNSQAYSLGSHNTAQIKNSKDKSQINSATEDNPFNPRENQANGNWVQSQSKVIKASAQSTNNNPQQSGPTTYTIVISDSPIDTFSDKAKLALQQAGTNKRPTNLFETGKAFTVELSQEEAYRLKNQPNIRSIEADRPLPLDPPVEINPVININLEQEVKLEDVLVNDVDKFSYTDSKMEGGLSSSALPVFNNGTASTGDILPYGVKAVWGGIDVSTKSNIVNGRYAFVIDSGVLDNTGDLVVNRQWSRSWVNGEDAFTDGNGHGTHVAGTIAALANGQGVVGVAPGAEVISLKVFDMVQANAAGFADPFALVETNNNPNYSTINTAGNVDFLKESTTGNGLFSVSVDGSDPIAIKATDGTHIHEGIYSGWQTLAAANIDGTNNVLWKNTDSNKLHTWYLDDNWTRTTSQDWIDPNSSDALTFESNFNIDLNGDNAIGANYSTINTAGNVDFLKESTTGNGLFSVSVDGSDPIAIKATDGTHIHEGIYSGWQTLAAANIDGTNNVLWKNTDSNKLHTWYLDDNWTRTTSQDWIDPNSSDALTFESNFNIDLNGDNAIGDDYSEDTNTRGRLSIGGFTTGVLETSGDRDWFKISLASGASYEFNHIGITLSDPYLYLRDQSGNILTSNDDGGLGYNSQITFHATSTGAYFIDAGSYRNSLTGSYILSAQQLPSPEPGFSSTDGWGEVSASRAFEQLLDINLPSVDDLGGNYWGLDNINAPEVWAESGDFSGATGEGVIVAVIDTGVDLDHAEFQGRMTAGYDFVDNDTIADDGNGHGTHVAGTIAGDDDDNFGISGVAPDALIMPIRVLNNNGNGYTSDIIEGITWAVDNGADVVNLSLGGGGYSQAMDDAIEYASNRGTVVVMASGNSAGNSPDYPAAHAVDHGIAVGAVDQNRNMANFSNLAGNTTLDYVTAPGVNIYSSVPNGQYSTFSGTSMATPHVAGVVALLKSYDNSLSASAIEDLITETSSNAIGSNSITEITPSQTSTGISTSNIITLETLSQFSEDQLATRLIGRIGSSNSQTNEEIIQKVNAASQGNTADSIQALGTSTTNFITFNLSKMLDPINETELLSTLLESNQFEYFEVDGIMTTLHTPNPNATETNSLDTKDYLTGTSTNTAATYGSTDQNPTLHANEEHHENFDPYSGEGTTYQTEIADYDLTSLSPSTAPMETNEAQQLPGLLSNSYLENLESKPALT